MFKILTYFTNTTYSKYTKLKGNKVSHIYGFVCESIKIF